MQPTLWLLIGVVALLGEALHTRLFLLNAAVAAFVVAPLALVVVLPIQVAAFVVISLLLLVLVRPPLLHALAGSRPRRALTTQGQLMDRTATVTRTVTDHSGMIRVGVGEFWTARTSGPLPPIAAGATVRITYVDGLTAYVEPMPALGAEALAPLDPPAPHGTGMIQEGK